MSTHEPTAQDSTESKWLKQTVWLKVQVFQCFVSVAKTSSNFISFRNMAFATCWFFNRTLDPWSIHFFNCQWSWRRRIEFVGILLVLGSICFNCLAPQTCFFEMDGCCLAGCQMGLFKDGNWGDEHNLFMGEMIVNDKPRHTYVVVLWCFGVFYCVVPGKPLQIHSEGLEVILLEPFIGEPAVPLTTSHRTHCALRECWRNPSPNICVSMFFFFNRWFSHYTWQLSKQACWISRGNIFSFAWDHNVLLNPHEFWW